MARALGVQSREIWQVTTGSLSVELEPRKTLDKTHVSCFAPPMTRSLCKSSLICGRHGITAVAQQLVYTTTYYQYACVDIAYACVLCVL